MLYRATLVIDVTLDDALFEDDNLKAKEFLVKHVRYTLTRQKKFIKPSNVMEIFRPVKEHPNDPPRADSKS